MKTDAVITPPSGVITSIYPLEKFTEIVERPPSTYVLEAFRNSSHNTTTATAELVDNPIDAEADNVWISFDKKNSIMFVADDGNGMNKAKLVDSVALGYRPNGGSLGRFAVGMKTACNHLGTDFSVYSKQENGTLMRVDHSTEELISSKKWNYTVTSDLTADECQLFAEKTEGSISGTLIVIRGIDKHFASYNAIVQFGKTLMKNLGEMFRLYLPPQVVINGVLQKEVRPEDAKTARLRLWIDGKCVSGKDPLERQAPNTKIMAQGTIESTAGQLEYTLVELNDLDKPVHNYEPDYFHQGFYVLREGRQIMPHDKQLFYDIWGREHSTATHLRCELRYSKSMDRLIHVNHDKVGIKEFDQVLMDQVKHELKTLVSQYKSAWKARRSRKPNEEVNKVHQGVEQNLLANASQLNLPSQRKVRRKKGLKTDKPEQTAEEKQSKKGTCKHGSSQKATGDLKKEKVDRFQIQHVDLTASGPVMNFEFAPNNVLVLQWNTSHPFVQKFITLMEEAPDETIKGLDNLGFAIASYWEQRVLEASDDSAWNEKDTFLGVLSQNLRIAK